jgi:hypothetical protein
MCTGLGVEELVRECQPFALLDAICKEMMSSYWIVLGTESVIVLVNIPLM